MKKYKYIKNHNKLSQNLASIAKHVHNTEDPFVITEYKKLFTRSVGIFSRANVTAYLIKKYFESQNTRKNFGGNKPSYTQRENSQAPESAQQPRYETYNLNVTKSDANYAEFKKFLTSLPNISNDNIVHIRLGDKNSMVRVRIGTAKLFRTVINGAKFKSITVQATPVVYKRN